MSDLHDLPPLKREHLPVCARALSPEQLHGYATGLENTADWHQAEAVSRRIEAKRIRILANQEMAQAASTPAPVVPVVIIRDEAVPRPPWIVTCQQPVALAGGAQ